MNGPSLMKFSHVKVVDQWQATLALKLKVYVATRSRVRNRNSGSAISHQNVISYYTNVHRFVIVHRYMKNMLGSACACIA